MSSWLLAEATASEERPSAVWNHITHPLLEGWEFTKNMPIQESMPRGCETTSMSKEEDSHITDIKRTMTSFTDAPLSRSFIISATSSSLPGKVA
jgi:hypothetical protein